MVGLEGGFMEIIEQLENEYCFLSWVVDIINYVSEV